MKNIFSAIKQTDKQLDPIDWQDVYNVSLPSIFHYFCYKVGDPIVAEDLTAITFEKAWKHRGSYHEDIGQVQSWLFGIARNVAFDHFRKNSREISLEDGSEFNLVTSFEDDVQRRLDFQSILKSLSQFPDRERELIAMKYGAELTNREIARLTGLSESNVGTILHRVVDKLRIEWEKNHER
jgi:RNA polymerase sigma-70 factor (ECF subfamily)